jgi:hypothetical protein
MPTTSQDKDGTADQNREGSSYPPRLRHPVSLDVGVPQIANLAARALRRDTARARRDTLRAGPPGQAPRGYHAGGTSGRRAGDGGGRTAERVGGAHGRGLTDARRAAGGAMCPTVEAG